MLSTLDCRPYLFILVGCPCTNPTTHYLYFWYTRVWFMHCHYEFHLSMGMAAVFIVEDGPTMDTSLPPPPVNFPTCGHDIDLMPKDFYLHTKKSET